MDRFHSTDIITGELMKLFQKYDFQHWRVQSIQATDQIDNDVIDITYDNTKKINYMFYIILECNKPIPESMSKEIHTSLHDDMLAFVVAYPNNPESICGKIVLKAHQKYNGNSFGILLEDKIRHYDDSVNLIIKAKNICPSLHIS